MSKPKYIRTDIQLVKSKIPVYASPRLAAAFQEVSYDMTVYKGVRLFQILEAVYNQGLKDGARSVFEEVDVLKGQISHRNPGQPKKH
jgi:hypothetical protein